MGRHDYGSSAGSVSDLSNGESGGSSHVKIQVRGDDDSVEQPQTLQTGIFGVLFTLSKEKSDFSFKIAALKMAVDFIQLFTIVINPYMGWNIDPNGAWWLVNWINITPLVQPWGYNFFIALLYIMVVLLVIAISLCIWVAWCFKNKNFAHIWPIVIVRFFIGIFFQVFDVASLNLLQIGLSCQFWGPQPPSMTNMLYAFPTYSCLAMPQLINMAVSAITLLTFVALVTLVNVSDFEMNPLSKRPYAMAHSGVEVKAFLTKFLMTLTTTFVGYAKPQSVLLLVFCSYLLWLHLRWAPFVMGLMNHARIGLYTAVWWSAAIYVILAFVPQSSSALTIVMIAGLGPMLVLGAWCSYLRLNLYTKIVLAKFRAAPPGTKAKDIFKFEDPRDVEIVMRSCRLWISEDVLDEEAVRKVEEVVKAGLQLFPSSAFMIITYSNFLVEVQGASQSGYSQVHAAKKANPSFMVKFAIFSREQQHLQSLSTEKSGQEAVDLISYVEFQRNQKRAINAHKEALMTIRFFWQELLKHRITFSSLSRALHRIDRCILDAEKVYKIILEQYPSSARLVRLYAMFLEDVKNDPARASKFFSEAEKLEGNITENFGDGLDEDEDSGEGAITTVSKNSCVVVINSAGIIQMVNKNTCISFGYHRTNDLKGKNVNTLVPPPFSQRHDTYLRNYLTTGKEHIINRVSEWIALHRDHYVFPCRLSVSKVSGAGEDSVFMGVLEPLPRKSNQASVWTLKGGSVVSVDQQFHDWFGYSPSDLVGKNINDLVVEPHLIAKLFEPMQRQLDHQQSSLADRMSDPYKSMTNEHYLLQLSSIKLRHKYTEPMDCGLKTTSGGVEHLKLLVFTFERSKLQPHTMVVDAKGHCEYATESLAQVLGRKATDMQKLRVHVSELMAQPYSRFHFKDYMQDIDKKPAPWSCRSGAPVMLLSYNGKKKIPAKLTIKSTNESGDMQHTIHVDLMEHESMLDSKRLRLYVNRQGIVTKVLAGCESLFGFKPEFMMNMPLALCVDVLQVAEKGGRVKELLESMARRSVQCPGESYRVIVTPSLETEDMAGVTSLSEEVLSKFRTHARMTVVESMANSKDSSALVNQLMQRKMNKRVGALEDLANRKGPQPSGEMEQLVLDGPNAPTRPDSPPLPESGHDFEVHLWRADLISAVVTLDHHGIIAKLDDPHVHQPGLLFGVPSPSLVGLKLTEIVGWSASLEALLGREGAKRGALKASMDNAPTIGPVHSLSAKHADGGDVQLGVQAITLEGVRRTIMVVLRLSEPQSAPEGGVEAMCRGKVSPIANPVVRRFSVINNSQALGSYNLGSHAGAYAPMADNGRRMSQLEVAEDWVNDDKAFGGAVMLLDDVNQDNVDRKLAPKVPVSRKVSTKSEMPTSQSARLTFEESATSEALACKGHARVSTEIEDGVDDLLPGTPVHSPKPVIPMPMLEHAMGSQSVKSSGRLSRASAWLEDVHEGKAGEDFFLASAYEGGVMQEPADDVIIEKLETEAPERHDSENMSDMPSSEFGSADEMQHQTDFQRAKRYKRILQLLSKTSASAWIRRLMRDSLFAVAVFIMANTACFAVLIVNFTNMQDLIQAVRLSGMLFIYLETIQLNLRSLQQAYLGGSPGLYTITDVPTIAGQLMSLQESFVTIQHQLYFSYTLTPAITNLWNENTQDVMLYLNSIPYVTNVTAPISLWTAGNYYLDNVAEVGTYHANYTTSLASMPAWLFSMYNGPNVLHPAYVTLQLQMIIAVTNQANELAWLQLLLLALNGVVMNALVAGYMLWLLTQVAHQRYNLYSVFHAIPIGLTRSLASKKVDLQSDEEEEAEELVPGALVDNEGAEGPDYMGAETVVTIMPLNDPSSPGAQSLASHGRKGSNRIDLTPSKAPFWSSLYKKVTGLLRSDAARNAGVSSKRKLVKNSHENLWLLTPFAIWALILMLIYIISYVQIGGLGDSLGSILASSLAQGLILRCTVDAQELCSHNGNPSYALRGTVLASVSNADLWYNLMLSGNETAAQMTEYPGVSFAPLVMSSTMQNILYGSSCIRTSSAPCVGPSSPYYAVTHRGLDAIVSRILVEGDSMLLDMQQALTLNNPGFRLMYEITFSDFEDGMTAIREEQVNQLDSNYTLVQTLQIIAYVTMFVIMFVFVFFLLFPFMARTKHESQRIAELLSQLPREVDVEKLILSVLTQAHDGTNKASKDGTGKKGASDKLDNGDKSSKPTKFMLEPLKSQGTFTVPSINGADSRRNLLPKSGKGVDGSIRLGRESNKVLPVNS